MIYALHGMMGHREDWNPLDLDLHAVDLWQSFHGSDKPGLENWALSFNEKVASKNGGILMGYSMGGRLALHVLLDRPDSWSGAVIISAHPGIEDNEERESRLVNDQQWAVRAREWAWSDFLKSWNGQTPLKAGPGSLFQSSLEGFRGKVAGVLDYWSLGRQEDLRPALAQCQIPVLWITGEQDEKFTRLAGEVADGNSNFEHVVIPNAGHRLLFESGEPLNSLKSLIGDFQKRIL